MLEVLPGWPGVGLPFEGRALCFHPSPPVTWLPLDIHSASLLWLPPPLPCPQQAPRRRFTSRQRTSRFMGVGSSNRKNQWQVGAAAAGAAKLALPCRKRMPHLVGWAACDDPFVCRSRLHSLCILGAPNLSSVLLLRSTPLWQARILVHGRVTHLGYYETEEEAARVYDK